MKIAIAGGGAFGTALGAALVLDGPASRLLTASPSRMISPICLLPTSFCSRHPRKHCEPFFRPTPKTSLENLSWRVAKGLI